jgi:Fe-Mn family superoxide dismutase
MTTQYSNRTSTRMELHHGKHHAGYVANLNATLDPPSCARDRQPGCCVWSRCRRRRATVHNQAQAGVVQHVLAGAAGGRAPAGRASSRRPVSAIWKFKNEFDAAGASLFGSGWVWLASTRRDGGKLVVLTTCGHDNPMQQDMVPILVNDVWEHAYYLKHQNRRPAYLEGWWAVANWREAERLFAAADPATGQNRGAEGGTLLAA